MLKTMVVLYALIVLVEVRAQQPKEILLSRQLIHEKIDAAQRDIYEAFLKTLRNSNRKENKIIPTEIVFSLFNKVDEIEHYIEKQNLFDSSKKVAFLNGLHEAIRSFEYYYKINQLNDYQIAELTDAYSKALDLEFNSSSILPVIRENAVEIGVILVTCSPFQSNIGILESKEFVVSKAYQKNPKPSFLFYSTFQKFHLLIAF